MSCESENSDGLIEEDLLIGEWVFFSRHDYFCETEEIAVERFDLSCECEYSLIFRSDGTYSSFTDGIPDREDEISTWSNDGGGFYSFYFDGTIESRNSHVVDFVDGEMRWLLEPDCFGWQGENIYSFDVYRKR